MSSRKPSQITALGAWHAALTGNLVELALAHADVAGICELLARLSRGHDLARALKYIVKR
ncbi:MULTISPECIES: hypothetical protein [unclassified Bradyrhizobium]